MDVVFYSHNKRINSLKLPTQGTTIPCVLKDSTSVVSPSLELRVNVKPPYNYAYIADFGRYYYVDDWSYNRGLWTCSLSVDVLTSWRTNILNTTAFVEYSTKGNAFNDIIDPRMMATESKLYHYFNQPIEDSFYSEKGCYILSVISTDANGYNGACAVYALTQHELQDFSRVITSQSFLDSVWTSITTSFSNPFEAIVSCRWIPFEFENLRGTTKEVYVVYAGVGVEGKLLDSNFTSLFFSATIPTGGVKVDYTDAPPFCTGILYLPFVGTVPIDLTAFYPDFRIYINTRCDIVTGDLVYTLSASPDADNIFSTYSGNCATQIPLSNSMVDSLGMLAGTAGIIGGIVSTARAIKNPVSNFASAFAKEEAVQSRLLATAGATFGTIRSAEVHTHINGALSSRIGAYVKRTFGLCVIRSVITDDIVSTNRATAIGSPFFATALLKTLSEGYVQCSGASVSAPATDSELSAINDFVNSGIYIE